MFDVMESKIDQSNRQLSKEDMSSEDEEDFSSENELAEHDAEFAESIGLQYVFLKLMS